MEQQQKKKGGCCLAFLVTALAVVMLVIALADYGVNAFLDQIQRVDEEATLSEEEIQAIVGETDPAEDQPETGPSVQPATEPAGGEVPGTEPSETVPPISQGEEVVNILLIGQDRRPGEGRQRSDTMILCTIDPRDKTMVMTSFLRDLYVDIPDWNGRSYQDNRLNICYALGGMGMLDTALRNNFGVTVDYNVEVDFSGFEDIVGLFGGVDIKLTKAEANYLGGGLKEGVNHLSPDQALAFVRIRKLDSDFGRTERQRRLLQGMLSAARGLSYDRLVKLVNGILPMITTDMTNEEITRYTLQLLPILSELEVTTQHIPAAGTYRDARIRGMAVLVPDLAANVAILKETLG